MPIDTNELEDGSWFKKCNNIFTESLKESEKSIDYIVNLNQPIIPSTFYEQQILHDKVIQLNRLKKQNLINPNILILTPINLSIPKYTKYIMKHYYNKFRTYTTSIVSNDDYYFMKFPIMDIACFTSKKKYFNICRNNSNNCLYVMCLLLYLSSLWNFGDSFTIQCIGFTRGII